jgi:hypothetical protein
MIRAIIAVVCGVIAGGTFNILIIGLLWQLYPLPEGANPSDPATMKTYVQSLPAPAFLIILVAHEGGALVGGFAAALMAGRSQVVLGAIVGGFFLLGGIVNVLSIPRGLWFAVVHLVLYVPCGIAGARLALCRTSSSEATT